MDKLDIKREARLFLNLYLLVPPELYWGLKEALLGMAINSLGTRQEPVHANEKQTNLKVGWREGGAAGRDREQMKQRTHPSGEFSALVSKLAQA